jgi:uncharacterized protein involved in response to NO
MRVSRTTPVLKRFLIATLCVAVIARVDTFSEDAWLPIAALWISLIGLLVVSYRDALNDWQSGRSVLFHPHIRYGLLSAAVLALTSGTFTEDPQPVSSYVFALGSLSSLVLTVMARLAARHETG